MRFSKHENSGRQATKSSAVRRLPAVFLAALAVLVLASCQKENKAEPERLVNVRIRPAETKSVRPYLETTGTLKAFEEVIISSEVDGILKRILVDEGSPIHTGMLLAEIPEVKSFYYVQGYGVYHNRAMMFLNLKPKAQRKRSQEDVKKIARAKLRAIPGLKVSAEDISVVGGGIRNVPIQFSIRGQDLNALQAYAKQISAEFARLPGVIMAYMILVSQFEGSVAGVDVDCGSVRLRYF